MFKNYPPTAQSLKAEFIEKNDDYPFGMLNAAAQMILYIDSPREVVRIGLQYLVSELSVCRADAGFATPSHLHYTPIAEFCNSKTDPPSITGLIIPNQHNAMQTIWNSDKPIKYEKVKTNEALGDLRQPLLDAGCRSMLLQKLTWEDEPIGIVCIDYTVSEHEWSNLEIDFMENFCANYLGPLAAISNYWFNPKMHSMFSKPTESELAAIRLAANGLSYKQIATKLSKSIRTVENQFRNARKRLGAKNQIELIKRCDPWL
ncbi:MAG: LuxR C-terminal-related transcriptional regulator [Pseudomonadota bacterium]